MAIDGGCWRDDLADRVGHIVRTERERLARRRPDLDAADLAAVEDTLWRIADHLLPHQARLARVDPVAAARLWEEAPVSDARRGGRPPPSPPPGRPRPAPPPAPAPASAA